MKALSITNWVFIALAVGVLGLIIWTDVHYGAMTTGRALWMIFWSLLVGLSLTEKIWRWRRK